MKNKQAKINYADLWGLREEKYKFLEENDVKTTKWQELQPKEPFHFFVIKDFTSEKEYKHFVPLHKIFREFTAGVVSGKDEVLTDESISNLKNRMLLIIESKHSNDTIKLSYQLNNSAGDKMLFRRKRIVFNEKYLQKYHYRPFDYRYIYYEREFLERHRYHLGFNLLKENLVISVSRLTANKDFCNVIASDCLPDYKLAESSRGSYFFPLYLYNDNKNQQTIFTGQEKLDLEGLQHTLRIKHDRSTNFKEEFLDKIDRLLIFPEPGGKSISYEEIFYYIYAILYSTIYRQKYQEFLKIDFPRIPFTKDYNLFQKLAELGEQLVNLHLLKSPELDNPISKFHGNNGNRVEKREYREKEKRVYINNHQYFSNIELNVWSYYIGGYQVLYKWFKDRKDRILTVEDIKHYCKIATALRKTITIQKQIGELYPKVEEKLA